MPELVLTTEITAPIEECFDLSLSVDAHTNSMERSGERIVAGVTSGSMKLGDKVTWQARHFGIPFRMTSKITEYESPACFVDQQTRGPFALWWHAHHFETSGGYRSSLIRAGGEGRPAARTVLPRRTSPTSWSRTDPSASVTRRTPCSTMTTWARTTWPTPRTSSSSA